MIRPTLHGCNDCGKTIACRCGEQADGSYHYDMDHAHSGVHGDCLRCRPCWKAFSIARSEESARKERERMASHLASNHDDGEACPECCEHEFDPGEGYHCLSCGLDGSEDVMADAYDRAKDRMKYGDS
jgi:hypothetical protein